MDGEYIEIDTKIESIKFVSKSLKIKVGTNISQLKKIISKMTYLPVSELVITELERPNVDEDITHEQQQLRKKNQYILQNKDVVIVEIATFYNEQIIMQFLQGIMPMHFKFQVYQSDLLKNLRTKIWLELRSKNKFNEPQSILMSIGGQHYVQVKNNDLFKTVQEFINENNIKQINGKYDLLIQEENQGSISLTLHDYIFSTRFEEIQFIDFNNEQQNINQIISLFEQKVQNTEQYMQLKSNSIGQSSSDKSYLQQLYEGGQLDITIENLHSEEESRPKIQQYLKNKPLTDGMSIGFSLVGIS